MSKIDNEELLALTDRIINSGVLGRSKKYGAILRYLVECLDYRKIAQGSCHCGGCAGQGS